jgi:hypothetical protein
VALPWAVIASNRFSRPDEAQRRSCTLNVSTRIPVLIVLTMGSSGFLSARLAMHM